MRAGSLCTGIGGLDLAVEAHFGAALAWYSELAPAPCIVLEREWPGVPNLGDLKLIDWSAVEPIDVLSAGYPCQPFSHAGKRKGTDDPRHLWPFIIEGVRALRPRYVVLENVRGHLSLGFDTVLGDLAEAGFDAEWCLLRASDVGACHQRARLFIVATDARGERHGRGQDPGALGRVDRGDAGTPRERQRPWEIPGDRSDAAPADATDLGHERRGPARRRGHGPTDSGHAAPHTDGQGQQGPLAELPAGRDGAPRRPASDADRGRLQECPQLDSDTPRAATDRHPCGGHPDGLGDVAWGVYEPAIRRHERAFGRRAPRPVDPAGRLAPAFVEWMQWFPAGWVRDLTRTQALKALGNAVVPQQAAAALAELAPRMEQAA